MTESVIQADCLEYLKTLPDNSLDAVVTDPPYELGFMGKTWDNTGIANSVELWSQVLRVLKPGGYLLSFGGTRTYHRMASAIEDAGFEVRDMVEWVYGSGFPKSLNIGKAVDKLQGNEREVVDKVFPDGSKPRKTAGIMHGQFKNNTPFTKGTSEWEGWGTALKPAHEPIVLARKPIEKGLSVAENCLKWGTGGINIDESRVEALPRKTGTKPTSDEATGSGNSLVGSSKNRQAEYDEQNLGRFPANLIHDNSEEVRECFPETKTGKAIRSNSGSKTFGGENTKPVMEYLGYDDNGGNSSRFFKSILYYPKASKKERNEGCEGLEEKEITTSKGNGLGRVCDICGATQLKPCQCNDNTWILPKKNKNNHPTVKPIALMEYLIQMVSRPGQTILDPFAGSGTTLVAAFKTGRGYIGIEKEEQYIPIINARLEGCKKSGATIPLCLMP